MNAKALSRVVVLLTAMAAVFLLLASSAAVGSAPVATERHLVRAGDTLWEVASVRAGPGEDVRRLVHEIRLLNGLSQSGLVPGQWLLVPSD